MSLLTVSPLTKGLFQNVIMQSGAATAKWAATSYKKVENAIRLEPLDNLPKVHMFIWRALIG